MTKKVRLAVASDLPESARTLAAAFQFYPWTRWTVPEDGYIARLERLQAIYLAHALDEGIVLVSENLDGAAALLPPGSSEPAGNVQAEIAELLGDRIDRAFNEALPQRSHRSWDFATIGVRPESAGQGVGSSIIAEALSHVSKSPFPRVSLETSDAKNVRLYERYGFVVSHRTEVESGPIVWTMSAKL